MMLFAEHLAYITAVTQALNKLPESKDFYVHVELREEMGHEKVGEWSDELGSDSWSFQTVDPEPPVAGK